MFTTPYYQRRGGRSFLGNRRFDRSALRAHRRNGRRVDADPMAPAVS